MYSIVDLETTGGNSIYHRIIEVAIYITDGEKILDEYQTLVNPEMKIPPYITAFTGISNEMVATAPLFEHVAQQIEEMTAGKVFVAHNVNFDYSFLRKEFNEIGRFFRRKKLCTVRLSRSIIPGMPSYGLGSLCSELGIPIYGRHRAAGDAEATVKLFQELIQRDETNFIEYSLNRNSKEALLPPNLPREQFEELPEEKGIYIFHDENGTPIYIGKAKNILERVSTHFAGNTNTNSRKLFLNSIFGVSYEVCGNELISLLYESYLIKKHWPRFNRSQKKVETNYGIYRYEDQNGYYRLAVNKISKWESPVATFRYLTEARSYLGSKVREFNLCPKLCGLQKALNECYDHKIGVCKGACCSKEDAKNYNKRLEKALSAFADVTQSYCIIGQGRSREEKSIVVVEKGSYLGFGYLEGDYPIDDPLQFKENIDIFPDNPDVQKILSGYLRKNNSLDQVISF
jgi:DNA polymerase-3 subunit epsilon